MGPKGLPRDRVKILHDAFHQAVESLPFKDLLKKFEAAYDYRDSEGFQKYIEELYNSRVELIKKYGEALK